MKGRKELPRQGNEIPHIIVVYGAIPVGLRAEMDDLMELTNGI